MAIIHSRDSAVEPARALAGRYQVDTAAYALDQTRFENVARLAAEVNEWKGPIDILVNNAGGGSGSSKAWLFSIAIPPTSRH